MTQEKQTQYCIYFDTHDYPGEYVVRQWSIEKGILMCKKLLDYRGKSLKEARKVVPKGYCNIGRYKADDEKITEVWI